MLSPRLQAIVGLIDCRVLADVGADHAYIPIEACRLNKAKRAVACDIKSGPLERAFANIIEHGLEHRVETRLGYGLEPLGKAEADCIVIAGVGGVNIIEILTKGRETAAAAETLILQPQRDVPEVRRALCQMSFEIKKEFVAREKNRFYHIISARFDKNNKNDKNDKKTVNWTGNEYITGKRCLQNNICLFNAWLEHEINRLSAYGKRTPETERLIEIYNEELKKG